MNTNEKNNQHASEVATDHTNSNNNTPTNAKSNPIAQHEQGTESIRTEVKPNENDKKELDPNNPKVKQENTKENQSRQTNKEDK